VVLDLYFYSFCFFDTAFLANVKQVLTIITSVGLFNLTVTGMNCTGVFLTLLGGVWYATVDYQEGRRSRKV
jgi:hypothetical protein